MCKCKSNIISCGVEDIIVNSKLKAFADYKYFIYDKLGTFSKEFTTDENGKFIINASDLPPGLFNTTKKISIKVKEVASGNFVEIPIMNYNPSVTIELVNVDGDTNNSVGVEFTTIE